MRGEDQKQDARFSDVSPEKRGPEDHPLRPIRARVEQVLQEMAPRFARRYAKVGRPSIAPERLLRARLLQSFYSVRSERLLMEPLDSNLLFRGFVAMPLDEEVWDHRVFSKNRDRRRNEEIAEAFFPRVRKLAQPPWSDEHCTGDGTLIEAWASPKSFRPQDEEPGAGSGEGEVDFQGEPRSNDTHQSTTDPEARLDQKSKGAEAKLSYLGHGLMENRHGLWVGTLVTPAHGTAERDAALLLAEKIPGIKRVTRGGDKNYDTRDWVRELRQRKITPQVAPNNTNRSSAIDGRPTRHAGYAISPQKRQRVEPSFGWMKVIGMLRKVKLRGREKVSWWFTYVGAAYNLVRLRNLQAEAVA